MHPKKHEYKNEKLFRFKEEICRTSCPNLKIIANNINASVFQLHTLRILSNGY